jgi:penicillin-binding protein 1A
VIRTARDLGIATPLTNTPALALGTSAATLLDMTAAYAAIAAGEYPVTPRGLLKAGKAGWGERLWSGQRPLGRKTQAAMLRLLDSAANRGTGNAAALSTPTFGKTGTTQDHRDAVFIGFAGDLVTGIWVGNDDNSPMNGVTGGGLPAEIWHDFMRGARLSENAPVAVAARPTVDRTPIEDILPEIGGTDLGNVVAQTRQAIETARDVQETIERLDPATEPAEDEPPPRPPETP